MSSIHRLFVVLTAGTLLVAPADFDAAQQGGQGKGTVRVEMEIYGGFAFLPEPGPVLNIAYLRDSNSGGCGVNQLGTFLFVESGEIIEPPIPATRTFDLAGTVLSFPDLPKGSLGITRGKRPDGGPMDPDDDDQWAPLDWIAGFTMGHAEPPTDFPKSTRRSDWRTMVDGHIEITAGRLRAGPPKDPGLRQAVFEFKTSPTAKPKFKHAVTDLAMWEATSLNETLRIARRTQLGSAMTPIVIRPEGPGIPVKLVVWGVHSHVVPPQLENGEVLPHFCAFYDLMQPRPAAADQLLPYVTGLPSIVSSSAGQPSPGAFCPGIWM